MPGKSESQHQIVDRVMREFKSGELKSGQGGGGGKVKSRKQAIAIALSESGQSRDKSPAENRRAERATKARDAGG